MNLADHIGQTWVQQDWGKVILDKVEMVVDSITKFHNYIYIAGWVNSPGSQIRDIRITSGGKKIKLLKNLNIPHLGVEEAFGPNKGFRVQALSAEEFNWEMTMTVITTNGQKVSTTFKEMSLDRIQRYSSPQKGLDYFSVVNADKNAHVLDIGGRDRSKQDLSSFFSSDNYVVLDILEGENVDVVGDAHELSELFPANHFDYVISISVFEHLLMPWKVAVEMNRVLKIGGKALIQTHQTIGMHDIPWDFWRFSDTAWDAIFNQKTGFRIIDRVIDFENFIIPFVMRPGKMDAEGSAGHEVSMVIVEKISDAIVDWPVRTGEITETSYPDSEDGSTGSLYESPIFAPTADWSDSEQTS